VRKELVPPPAGRPLTTPGGAVAGPSRGDPREQESRRVQRRVQRGERRARVARAEDGVVLGEQVTPGATVRAAGAGCGCSGGSWWISWRSGVS
jgi:hypothetical protein